MGAGEQWTEADKHQLRTLVASGIGLAAVAEAMGRTPGGVASAAKRYGAIWPKNPSPTMPADFAELWHTMGLRALAAHLGVSEYSIVQWRDALGLKRASSLHVTRAPKPEKPKPIKRGVSEFMGQPRRVQDAPIRDMSLEGRAQQHLQRWTMVYRKGDGWVYGSRRMTGAELVARAKEKGFVV